MTAGTSSVIKELDNTFGQDDIPISKSWIVLDIQSTVNCFCEEKYLDNICQVESTALIRCNGGVQKINWMRDFRGFPEPVWLDKGGIANIIYLKRVKKYFKILYDSDDGNGFVVIHRVNGSFLHLHES